MTTHRTIDWRTLVMQHEPEFFERAYVYDFYGRKFKEPGAVAETARTLEDARLRTLEDGTTRDLEGKT